MSIYSLVTRGHVLFTAYTTPLADILDDLDIVRKCYADDKQLMIAFSPKEKSNADEFVARMQECCLWVYEWLTSNFLSLNRDKTEFELIGIRQQLCKISIPTITIGDSIIHQSNVLTNLGVKLDKK